VVALNREKAMGNVVFAWSHLPKGHSPKSVLASVSSRLSGSGDFYGHADQGSRISRPTTRLVRPGMRVTEDRNGRTFIPDYLPMFREFYEVELLKQLFGCFSKIIGELWLGQEPFLRRITT